MATKEELHAEVDAEWKPIIEAYKKLGYMSFGAQMEAFDMWAFEKRHIDKFGQRMPKIVNISVPEDLEEPNV